MTTTIGPSGPTTGEIETIEPVDNLEINQTRYLLFTNVKQAQLPSWIPEKEKSEIMQDHPTGLSYTIVLGNRIHLNKDGELAVIMGGITIAEINPYDVLGNIDRSTAHEIELAENLQDLAEKGSPEQFMKLVQFAKELYKDMVPSQQYARALDDNKNLIGIVNNEGHRIALKPKFEYDWGDVPIDAQERIKNHREKSDGGLDGVDIPVEEGYLIPTLNNGPMTYTLLHNQQNARMSEDFMRVTFGDTYNERKGPLNDLATMLQGILESSNGDVNLFVPINHGLVAPTHADYKPLEFKPINGR